MVSEAKIAEVGEHTFVLLIDGKAVPVDDDPETRYWIAKERGLRSALKVGDSVGVRVKTDVSPAQLREMADLPSWSWLNRIRKETVGGEVVRADAKWLTLRFADGSQYSYRVTPKAQFDVAKKAIPIGELTIGQRLYVKGRLSANLETYVVTATDVPPPPEPPSKSAKKDDRKTPLKLAASGTLKGEVDFVSGTFGLLDIRVQDRVLHITVLSQALVTRNGVKVALSAIQKGDMASIAYRRDSYGRLLTSKVAVRGGSGTE